MGTLDSRIAAALDGLVPPRQQPEDWETIAASVPTPDPSPRTARRRFLAVPILIGACALLALPAYAVADRIIAAFTGTTAPLPLGGAQNSPSVPITPAAGTECTTIVRFSMVWPTAPPAAIDALRQRLREDAQVRSFVFISRAQSFAQLKEQYPDLVKGLRFNPFPDLIDAQLEESVDARQFVARYRALHLPALNRSSRPSTNPHPLARTGMNIRPAGGANC